MEYINRRNFLKSSFGAGGVLAAAGAQGTPNRAFAASTGSGAEKKFKISLAAWSLNRTFRTTLTNLDLPRIAREEFGLDGLEFVNSFFDLPNYDYLRELKPRAGHYGVNLLLIMVDREGDMSHEDRKESRQRSTTASGSISPIIWAAVPYAAMQATPRWEPRTSVWPAARKASAAWSSTLTRRG